MDYFSLLELDKEPFSNSPDPAFFYEAAPHLACLQQLELSIRLKRGLSVVMGRVGTGKTTISRELVRRLGNDESIQVHLILDPSYSSGEEFLQAVEAMLLGEKGESLSVWQRKERIKNALFEIGVADQGTVVLLIDEGQKLSIDCLEIIREFLNYETNTQKLLQVVIFAQEEFERSLERMENFKDRINCLIRIGPMSFAEMRSMIAFRLKRSSSMGSLPSFSFPALWCLYRLTKGYPRKVINMAHRVLLIIIVQGRNKVRYKDVVAAGGIVVAYKKSGKKKPWLMAFGGMCLLLCGYWVWLSNSFSMPLIDRLQTFFAPQLQEKAVDPYPRMRVVQSQIAKAPQGAPATGTDSGQTSQEEQPKEKVRSEMVEEAETQPDKAANTIKDSSSPVDRDTAYPDTLGTIVVERGDAIFGMARVVYTARESNLLVAAVQKVLDENPELKKNPDNVAVGTIVRFPTPVRIENPFPGGRYWVRVATTASLREAYLFTTALHKKYTHHRMSEGECFARLIISGTRDASFLFSVILNRSFSERSAALAALVDLDPAKDGVKEPEVICKTAFEGQVLFSPLP